MVKGLLVSASLVLFPLVSWAVEVTGDLASCFKYMGRQEAYGIMADRYDNNCGKAVSIGVCLRDFQTDLYSRPKPIGCTTDYKSPGQSFFITGGAISISACSGKPILDETTGSATCSPPKTAPRPPSVPAASSGSSGNAGGTAMPDDEPKFRERPSKGEPVNKCLKVIDKRGAGFEKALQNSCSFPIQFTYCVEDPKSLFRCRVNPPKGEGAGSVGPGKFSAIPDWYQGGRIHWIACKGKLGEVLPMMNSNGKTGCF